MSIQARAVSQMSKIRLRKELLHKTYLNFEELDQWFLNLFGLLPS